MIPDYQTIMLPLLKYTGDNKTHSLRDAVQYISDHFELTEEERKKLLPSGKQEIIKNRIGWARTYMKKAGLLDSPKRGFMKITERGKEVIEHAPETIDVSFLERFPEFIEFKTLRRDQEGVNNITESLEEDLKGITPDEMMEQGFNLSNESLGQELLDKIRECSPDFFEHVVLDLLTGMGYGEGKVTGQPGDGGIDGIVHQDKLGLEKIYFQAKKFAEGVPVTALMIRDFVGALELKGASKGVFITTSRFPRDAQDVIQGTHKSIVLINGSRLVQLMIEHNIGVSSEKIYQIKKLDSDYFPEE